MTTISNIPAVQSIVKTVLHFGIDQAVLSPGSRNAPFLISFSAIESIKSESIVDERVAAFVALGKAQQTGSPVILCCTSGSAILNYSPAIAEAYYQNIPLIIITADRPKEWIDRGEGQSIRQMEVISGIVSKQVEWDYHKSEADNQAIINEVFKYSIEYSSPVHINVPLHEPLYGVDEMDLSISSVITNTKPDFKRIEKEDFVTQYNSAIRIMIVCAQMNGLIDCREQVKRLSEDPRVVVLTETTANLYQLGYVCCIDRTLAAFSSENTDFVPDLVITIGENIISKRLKQYLRNHKERIDAHWHFGLKSMDVFDVARYSHGQNVREALASLAPTAQIVEKPFSTLWKNVFFKSEQSHLQALPELPYSDLKVFESIMDLIPDDWQIQMGNSSVVRYFQLFNQLPKNKYFGNRGVSGIDGCTSTAVGASKVSRDPVLLVSGDHAFRYDANALGVTGLPPRLKIIVINNEGGNIFRIIDGPRSQESIDVHIEHHEVKSVKGLVQYHGVEYRSASDIQSLETELAALFDSANDKTVVLEVFTPRLESPDVLKRYFASMR